MRKNPEEIKRSKIVIHVIFCSKHHKESKLKGNQISYMHILRKINFIKKGHSNGRTFKIAMLNFINRRIFIVMKERLIIKKPKSSIT